MFVKTLIVVVLLSILNAAASAQESQALIADADRYIIQDDVLIRTPHGATLSAFVVRPRDDSRKLPAALQFNIYA